MGIRQNCCDCDDLFFGVNPGDNVTVQSAGNTTQNGDFLRIDGNVVVLEVGQGQNAREVRICCSNIFSVELDPPEV
ncbi:hypothetical protein [Neobacillus niacini]|uniref:hypothetical protein n=1 Tax=Neobacillus niacini TaxID=86668 RepID=UPI0020404BE7|nr:hypothetical protein [Neobacillus niacini]MCM3692004.1 hypothetical protein [Neobacillus niacini]